MFARLWGWFIMRVNGVVFQSEFTKAKNNDIVTTEHYLELQTAINKLNSIAGNVDNCGNCNFCQACQANTCQRQCVHKNCNCCDD